MNFYPHHIGDFNNATRHLTRVERSVYRDAIELYYDTESALTSDVSKLEKRLICRLEDEKSALKSVLEEFFELTDDGYFHVRCDSEIAKYRANTSAKSKAGKASAEARGKRAEERKKRRREKNEQNLTGVEQVLDSVTAEAQQNPTNQEPLTINQEPIKKSVTKKSSRFKPPSLQDVIDYKKSRDSPVDPNRFVDFYMSKDWMVGKTKMKDWKAAFRNWESREGGSNGYQQPNQPSDRPRSGADRLRAIVAQQERDDSLVGEDARDLRPQVGRVVRDDAQPRLDLNPQGDIT